MCSFNLCTIHDTFVVGCLVWFWFGSGLVRKSFSFLLLSAGWLGKGIGVFFAGKSIKPAAMKQLRPDTDG